MSMKISGTMLRTPEDISPNQNVHQNSRITMIRMTVIELSTNLPTGTHFLYCIEVVRNWTLKDIRIRVETNDGCCTIWYERSKQKCSTIQERVYNQLCGLNIKEIDVSIIGAWHEPFRTD